MGHRVINYLQMSFLEKNYIFFKKNSIKLGYIRSFSCKYVMVLSMNVAGPGLLKLEQDFTVH